VQEDTSIPLSSPSRILSLIGERHQMLKGQSAAMEVVHATLGQHSSILTLVADEKLRIINILQGSSWLLRANF
jgi:hypothetical protein